MHSATAGLLGASCWSHTKDSRHLCFQSCQAHQFQTVDWSSQQAPQQSETPTPDSSWRQHYPEKPKCRLGTHTGDWERPPAAQGDCETPRLDFGAESAQRLSLEYRECLCQTWGLQLDLCRDLHSRLQSVTTHTPGLWEGHCLYICFLKSCML